MAGVSESTLRKILKNARLRPFKVAYYCEKRDPDFEAKMHNVLVVYKQVSMQFDEEGNIKPFEGTPVHTLSLLTGIDLLTGEAVPYISETHKSSDFVYFLKMLDKKYPEGDRIRLILDNHSAHTSQETQKYLNEVPDRFEFVFTPTHGSWLNMVEGFFSKMTKQMLGGIRVSNKEELKERMYKYFDGINKVPVPYHWSYKLDDIDLEKEDISQFLSITFYAQASKCLRFI